MAGGDNKGRAPSEFGFSPGESTIYDRNRKTILQNPSPRASPAGARQRGEPGSSRAQVERARVLLQPGKIPDSRGRAAASGNAEERLVNVDPK
jgi:hypothetical protein